MDYQLTPAQSIRVHDLASADELNYVDELETKRLDTEYLGHYLWLSHRAVLSAHAFTDTAISTTQTRRDRRAVEADEDRSFAVRDRRDLAVSGMNHSWNVEAGERHALKMGVDYRKFDATYDYLNSRTFTTLLSRLRSDWQRDSFAAKDRITRDYLSIYGSDRVRPIESMTLDIGLRYDRHTSLDDSVLTPRFSGAWAFRDSTTLRIGWGRYSQTHRAYEVMVEDGDARLYEAERSGQAVAGVEHVFNPSSRVPLASMSVEIYRRDVSTPRPRYTNLFDSFDPFPEGQLDRVRVEPQRSRSQGMELSLRGRSTSTSSWWLNYALAAASDQIDGREVRRETDRTHALNVDVNRAIGRRWNLNVAWVYRTGWPTTPITVTETRRADGGIEFVPALGRPNSERLPSYHRLDLRLSRDWQVASGTFTFFVDGRNLYSRRNASGLDVKLDRDTGILETQPERWPGFLASAGVVWKSR